MKNNTAYIVNAINSITGHPPVKKALQKMIFLMEKRGVQLGFEYILHFYGPYCAELDRETLKLNSDGIITIDYSKYGHRLKRNAEFKQPIETNLPDNQVTIAKEVIKRYKDYTPAELELLTTAIYAYEHTNATTRTQVIDNIKKIKGEKFSNEEITKALSEFPYFGIEV